MKEIKTPQLTREGAKSPVFLPEMTKRRNLTIDEGQGEGRGGEGKVRLILLLPKFNSNSWSLLKYTNRQTDRNMHGILDPRYAQDLLPEVTSLHVPLR